MHVDDMNTITVLKHREEHAWFGNVVFEMHRSGLIWSEGKINVISKTRREPKANVYYSLESM